MGEELEIKVEALMEEIREKIREHQHTGSSDVVHPSSNDAIRADLNSLHNNHNISNLHFTSQRKVLGRLIVGAKKALRQLLTPILERQSAYNAANARLGSHLYHLCQQIETVGQHQDPLSQALRDTITQALQGMVVEQIEVLGQQQAEALQALQNMVVEQIEVLGQQQSEALQALRQIVFDHLDQRVKHIHKEVTAHVQTQQETLSHMEGTLADTLADEKARLVETERMHLRLRADIISQERRINILLEEARKRLPEPFSQEQLRHIAEEERHTLDALYLSFEDQFRGSWEDIQERLRIYVPMLKEAQLGTAERPVLDLGCGRGEWLHLLKEQGSQARGVDRNHLLIEACRQRDLDVIESDALAYLRTLPDASVGAVTGFHFLEHLPFETVIKVLDETVRVLQPGGAAIFETPNPENVLVGSHTFYLDPTHRNPLPSAVLTYIAEARGLCRVQTMHLHPYAKACQVEEAGLDVAKRFNEYFYGPQDYAVIGWKM
jgi:O-antigen chain-terminating methyltransferase